MSLSCCYNYGENGSYNEKNLTIDIIGVRKVSERG